MPFSLLAIRSKAINYTLKLDLQEEITGFSKNIEIFTAERSELSLETVQIKFQSLTGLL